MKAPQTSQIGSVRDRSGKASKKAPATDMVWIEGGSFTMGSDDHYPEEAPAHAMEVDSFWIDKYAVTNAQFSKFYEATKYVTLAERPPKAEDYPGALPELLVPASVMFKKAPKGVSLADHYNWWTYVPGADWRHPYGPDTDLKGRAKYPVVHIAYEDAIAYAEWAGKDLPTEAEWEFASRGGGDGTEYAWGDELTIDGKHMANTWQGDFPSENSLEDGYEWSAPVGSFPPNGYGLYDMIGNVWEWTTDWYQEHHDALSSCCGNPKDKIRDREKSYDPRERIKIPRRVMKGGSYLCAPNYCKRYRPAARMAQAIDTSTCHLGFRCVIRPTN